MINQGKINSKPYHDLIDTGQLESDHIEKESLTKREDILVFYGVDAVIDSVIQFLNQTDESVYACVDQTRPILTLDIQVLRKAFEDAKRRGVKLMYVTEITKENLFYCKQLMEMTHELRHLEGIKGNFYISETGYLAPATYHEKGKPASQIIYSNVNEIIEHQKYVFESFWYRAIPAEQRIREIEAGIDSGNTEVVYNPQNIYELFFNMVKFAKYEILLIIPTINAFLRKERIGMIKLLMDLSTEHGITVRILTPTDHVIDTYIHNVGLEVTLEPTTSREQEKDQKKGIAIYKMNPPYEQIIVNTITILVVDKKESLAIEKKDDSEQDFIRAIGLATHSNSEPTVRSYVSIFESLWKQTELFEQLKLHDKMQKEFINIAAHEMRTPTQAILGTSGLLQYYPERKDKLIEIISRNAKRLQTLTSEILDVTRIEGKTFWLEKKQFNIFNLLSEVIDDYTEKIRGENRDIELIYEQKNTDNNIIVEVDKGRIVQVLSNILNNALKFTEEGQIIVEAHESNKKEIVVSISDTGSGINEDILCKLFSKFVTKSFQGTGLGLYISRSIIEAHGGRIWAENRKDRTGSTFIFTLPTVNEDSAGGENRR